MSTTTPALHRIAPTEADTEKAGAAIASALQVGDIVALGGDLGAGKTCFVRGLARGLGADSSLVRSPTFVLHHVYPGGRVLLHHLDCYRLGPGADLRVIDVDDLVVDALVAVEWAGYTDLRPYTTIPVDIEILSTPASERRLTLGPSAPPRVRAAWTADG